MLGHGALGRNITPQMVGVVWVPLGMDGRVGNMCVNRDVDSIQDVGVVHIHLHVAYGNYLFYVKRMHNAIAF